MFKKFTIIFWMSIAILSVFFLIGCSTSEEFPDIGIPQEQMNTAFNLTVNPIANQSEQKNGGLIFLKLQNTFDQSIVFPPDCGINIYRLQDGKWLPVENLWSYGEIKWILQSYKESPLGLYCKLMPFIPELQEEETLRIILIGHKYESEDAKVGAYIDITIEP